MGIETAALAAGVAASAASAATDQSGESLGMVTADRYKPRSKQEKLAAREVLASIDAQNALISNNLGQFNLLASEKLFLEALGVVPQFEDTSGEVAALLARRDELNASLMDSRAAGDQAQQIRGERQRINEQLKKTKDPAKRAELRAQKKALAQDLKAAKPGRKGAKFNKGVRQEMATIDERLRTLESQPRRITGFREATPDELPPDSPLSSRNPLNIAQAERNEQLIRALRGETEPSSRLTHQYEQRKQYERERLRRQMGPDFENSSQGIEALSRLEANFGEAAEEERRKTIQDLSSLNISAQAAREQSRAALLQAGVFLPTTGAQLAGAFNDPIQNTLGLLQTRQADREQLGEGGVTEQGPGALSSILGRAGSGLGSAATGGSAGLGSFLAKGA